MQAQPVLSPPEPALIYDAVPVWPQWRRVLFRFTAVYLLVYMASALLSFAGEIPGVGIVGTWYAAAETWLVEWLNARWWHIKDQLVPLNGSGDTSYGYAQLCFFTLVAVAGAALWTARARRQSYEVLSYWLLVGLRYFVAMTALLYGIIKLFHQQMPFPSQSELATPLGDLLPMRFSWFFIGYSAPYEFFSGLAEVVAGALLLWRRTATLGALVATGVFLNVMMLNLCYDIPVKLFSTHLFVFSLLLLLADSRRLLDFFIFNRPTLPRWEPPFVTSRARWGRVAAKVVFLVVCAGLPLAQSLSMATELPPRSPLPAGYYEITAMEPTPPDSLRWHDLILESGGAWGSIRTDDHQLGQRYRRGYFTYALDSLTGQVLTLRRGRRDTVRVATFRVQQPDSTHLTLRGRYRGDSLRVQLHRVPRHFQLAERQFHWLSEANR